MSVDFEAIRKQEWPVLEQMVFLDAACVSFAPQRTVRAVKAFADMTATQEEENSSAHHIAMDSLRGKAYDEAAKLLNAAPDEIALVESTSHGLNIAARGKHHHHQSGVHSGGPALVCDAPGEEDRDPGMQDQGQPLHGGRLRRPGR